MARSGVDRTTPSERDAAPRAEPATDFGPISRARFGRPANDNRPKLALLPAGATLAGAAAVGLIYAIARWAF